MYILETNSFKYYLGERLLFKLPALKLHTKSRIGLIGLNGSGKTTLLELLAGIRPIPAAAKIICKTTMTILPQLKERLSKSGGETTQAYILQALKQQSDLLLADDATASSHSFLLGGAVLRHRAGAASVFFRGGVCGRCAGDATAGEWCAGAQSKTTGRAPARFRGARGAPD